MRSCVLILTVLLLGAPSLSAEESTKPVKSKPASPAAGKKQQGKSQRQTANTQSTPLSSDKAAPSEPKPDQKEQTPEQQPQQSTKWWQEINWSGWGQVIVSGFGLYIIWRTLGAVQDQAKASQDTATAALKQAESIVATERAYVFGKAVLEQEIIPSQTGNSVSMAKALFINHGKTPATILKIYAWHVISSSPPISIQIPTETASFPEGLVIASEGIFEAPVPLRITHTQWEELTAKKKTLYCFGLIEYKDVTGGKRETTFCWEYMPHVGAIGRFSFSSNSPLNKYT